MKEKAINDNYHEKGEIQRKFNGLKENKSNSSRIDVKAVPIEHLRSYAILRCGSISQFSEKLGVERSMGSKILSGKYIPKKTSTIERIAGVLGLNPVEVTKMFQNLQNEKEKKS